jgi:hypothetical protein
MLAAMKAVWIPVAGAVEVVELDTPDDGDATAFLVGLYAAIGCRSVECVELSTVWDMWVDETGMVDDRAANRRATLLAQSCGFSGQIFGTVIVTGANDADGQPMGLTSDQADSIVLRLDGLTALDGTEPATQANLRHLLNAWDPIGVADVVDDEYDCLIGPLLQRLIAGGGRAEISEFLWTELEDHFGLDPHVHEVDKVANKLVAWWAAHASQ